MGFFNFPFGKKSDQKPAAPAPAQTAPQPKQSPAPSPAASKPSAPGVPAPAAPAQSAPAKTSAPAAAPAVHLEVKKILFIPTSYDPAKLSYFVTKLIRAINYEWHYDDPHHKIQGRIGMHSDKKKIHIEAKGTAKDLEKLIAWCKLDHSGIHAKDGYVEKYIMSTMPYSGLFQKKEGTMA